MPIPCRGSITASPARYLCSGQHNGAQKDIDALTSLVRERVEAAAKCTSDKALELERNTEKLYQIPVRTVIHCVLPQPIENASCRLQGQSYRRGRRNGWMLGPSVCLRK